MDTQNNKDIPRLSDKGISRGSRKHSQELQEWPKVIRGNFHRVFFFFATWQNDEVRQKENWGVNSEKRETINQILE